MRRAGGVGCGRCAADGGKLWEEAVKALENFFLRDWWICGRGLGLMGGVCVGGGCGVSGARGCAWKR